MITFSCRKTNLDLELKKSISMSGSIFNTKSTCFQRFVQAGKDVFLPGTYNPTEKMKYWMRHCSEIKSLKMRVW